MKKAAKQSVERHSFPATRLWKITAGPERPIAAPIKWRTVTAQWETDPQKHMCVRGDSVWFLARKLAASQRPVDPNRRGRKWELNTERKSIELDGGCKRVGEKDGERETQYSCEALESCAAIAASPHTIPCVCPQSNTLPFLSLTVWLSSPLRSFKFFWPVKGKSGGDL